MPAESRNDQIRRLAQEIGQLTSDKNIAYGSSFELVADHLKLLFPDGVQPDQYRDMLLLARIFDKEMRIANRKNAFGESPYRDIAGYGICGAAIDEEQEHE